METFEEYWMKNVKIYKDFEGERTFENLSKYFNIRVEREIWDYQQKKIDILNKQITVLMDK